MEKKLYLTNYLLLLNRIDTTHLGPPKLFSFISPKIKTGDLKFCTKNTYNHRHVFAHRSEVDVMIFLPLLGAHISSLQVT